MNNNTKSPIQPEDRLDDGSADAFVYDEHSCRELQWLLDSKDLLSERIAESRLEALTIGTPLHSQGVQYNSPAKVLQAVMQEAVACDPCQGWQPGNPHFLQTPERNLDPTWKTIKGIASELHELYNKARSHAQAAHQAILDNDLATAVCQGIAAARTVEQMKLKHASACEISHLNSRLNLLNKQEAVDRCKVHAACKPYWKRHPKNPIRGENGILSKVKVNLLGTYTPETLDDWAAEVAPPDVKNRRGRPPKE